MDNLKFKMTGHSEIRTFKPNGDIIEAYQEIRFTMSLMPKRHLKVHMGEVVMAER